VTSSTSPSPLLVKSSGSGVPLYQSPGPDLEHRVPVAQRQVVEPGALGPVERDRVRATGRLGQECRHAAMGEADLDGTGRHLGGLEPLGRVAGDVFWVSGAGRTTSRPSASARGSGSVRTWTFEGQSPDCRNRSQTPPGRAGSWLPGKQQPGAGEARHAVHHPAQEAGLGMLAFEDVAGDQHGGHVLGRGEGGDALDGGEARLAQQGCHVTLGEPGEGLAELPVGGVQEPDRHGRLGATRPAWNQLSRDSPCASTWAR
jgi:hypothetical protein